MHKIPASLGFSYGHYPVKSYWKLSPSKAQKYCMRTSLHCPCCFSHPHLAFQNITFHLTAQPSSETKPQRGHLSSSYTFPSPHWYKKLLCRCATMDQAVPSVSLPPGLSMVFQSTAETSLFIFSVSPV